MKRFLSGVLLIIICAVTAAAQDDETPAKHELMVWGGYAPVVGAEDPAGGRTWNASFAIAGVRYSHRWNTASWVDLKYTADLIPVAVLNYPDSRAVAPGPGRVPARETRVAFGGSPVGIQANFRPRKKLQPFIGASLSALVFNKTVPNDFGKRLNFGSEGGIGIEYRLANRKAVTFGYKFLHISNASRGEANPGYDAQLFYLGYTFYGR